MIPELRDAVGRQLGTRVLEATRLGGGDINDAFEVSLEDRTRIFVKTHPDPPGGMFGAEARGLRWLEETKAIRIPRVIAFSDEQPAYLALELLTPAQPQPDFEEALGHSLAALHAFGSPSFGLDHDNSYRRRTRRPTIGHRSTGRPGSSRNCVSRPTVA
ncbi:MAG: fructosamine kinase family protein [Deltaproteobacteria bacterium]|nr:fructosamine kinase family protein [Deltaproteobacteria bacterium]